MDGSTDGGSEFRDFVDQVGRAAGDFVAGDPGPYRALWSDGDDVSIFGGWDDYETGWDEVGPRLEWAGARFVAGGWTHQEVLTMPASGDLGYTVSLERGTAPWYPVRPCDSPVDLATFLAHITAVARVVDRLDAMKPV
jgi:hypothetical protein